MNLLAIHWTVDPTIFEIGPLTVRWYGLLFAGAFLAGYYVMLAMIKHEKMPREWLDSLLLYVMIGTVLGARLGHVFFYQWEDYKDNLIEILMVWKGGLASHGAAVGIIVALSLWSWKVSKKSVLYILDRVVITVALSGLFIRMGNLMNHEIVGAVTGNDSGFKFLRNADDLNYVELGQKTGMTLSEQNANGDWEWVPEKIDQAYDLIATNPEYAEVWNSIPARYPAQIWEAGSYLFIFFLLYAIYRYAGAGKRQGLIFGLFLVLVFSARFIIEFFKEVQVEAELDMAYNLGQQLSVPLILAGVFFVIRAFVRRSTVEA